MPFPTVKSDPWKRRQVAKRHSLWPSSFWKRLVEQARRDGARDVSLACVEMISETNLLLYGKR
jgi:hypothetical protein